MVSDAQRRLKPASAKAVTPPASSAETSALLAKDAALPASGARVTARTTLGFGAVMRLVRVNGLTTSLINSAIRGSTIASRFLLTFFIARDLGLEATGIYGLTLGAIGLVPAIVGFGLNYQVSREVVGLGQHDTLRTMFCRYIVSCSALTVATVVLVTVVLVAQLPLTLLSVLCIAIVWLETIALDTHLPLIGMELALEANILLFIRTASWVLPVITVEYLFPQTRSLSVILGCWIASHLISIYMLSRFLKDWPLEVMLSTRFRFEWLSSRLRRSWLIYLSDLGLAGSTYIDRYLVNTLLGIVATGVFSFYWALANAVQTLVSTAVVQLALPSLVKLHRSGQIADWERQLRREGSKAVGIAFVLAVLIYFAAHLLLLAMQAQNLAGFEVLFVCLLASVVARVGSDILNIALTSRHLDKEYAFVNIAGIVIAVATSSVCIWQFGLLGAGAGALVSNLILLAMRIIIVRAPRLD